MDTITHGIAGALVAKSYFPERSGRAAVIAVTIGSVFPDSDTLARYFCSDRIAYLTIHRGITHSLIMLPLFAAALGVLTAIVMRHKSDWLLLSACYAAGIALHIGMDLITSFGTIIWDPVSNVRVSWDMTFIVDIVFTTIVLLPQLVSWAYSDRLRAGRRRLGVWIGWNVVAIGIALIARVMGVPISGVVMAAGSAIVAAVIWLPALVGAFEWPRSKFCRIGVGIFAMYLCVCAAAHHSALDKVQAVARDLHIQPERIAALPAPPSFLRWSGLVQTSKGIYQIPINLADSMPLVPNYFPNSHDNEYVEAAKRLDNVQTYLWFARFPWVTYQRREGVNIVEFRDLQFMLPRRRGNSPFTLRVALDNQGRLLSSTLLER